MSEISDMIQRLCPDGVEYKKLGEVCLFGDGFPINAKDIKEQGLFPVIKIGNIDNGHVIKQDCYLEVLPLKVKKSQILEGGEILVGMSGSTGKTGYNSLRNAIVNQRIAIIRNNPSIVLNGFLKHLLVNNNFEEYCFQKGTGPQHNISKFDLLAYEIPVPPLEVQRKIVEILDNFSELTAELTAELEARRKQYEYYRDNILNFNRGGQNVSDVKWMKMSEVGTFTRGRRFVRADIVEQGYPCIHYGDMYTYYGLSAMETKTYIPFEVAKKLRFAQKNDVVIVGAGENDEDIGIGVAWLGDTSPAVHDACYIFHHNQNPKFVSHYLRTSFYHKQIKTSVSSGKICSISAEGIGKALIPIPPLAEQERIVSILDRFEALTTDLTSGLPAEIKARQQQYEYYRDQLLTFKRAN